MENKYVTSTDLRAMADWLDTHSEVRIPAQDITIWASPGNGTFQDQAKKLGTFTKEYTPSFVYASVSFGALRLRVADWREAVCKKVQVGVKHVEARTVITEEPAHDEPIYKWECPESWLDSENHGKEVEPNAKAAF